MIVLTYFLMPHILLHYFTINVYIIGYYRLLSFISDSLQHYVHVVGLYCMVRPYVYRFKL